MGRLVRAERVFDGDRAFLVAGERGVIELREHPDFWCFYVHSPVWLAKLAKRAVGGMKGRRSLSGLALHGCYLLEGECWTGLVAGRGYDFDRPDAGEVPQWEALEGLYRLYLG